VCGLAGFAALGGVLPDGSAAVAAAMAGELLHRGPDDAGVWSDERVALAFRRLAIIDLSATGAQPMRSESGRLTIVFNGEIYNYRTLADQLRSEGWQPRGGSDTEVLLAGVERWGLDRFLEQADGMFAFALYDAVAATLALVRDRFGEKPLCYAIADGGVAFASELRAFWHLPGADLSLDPVATADYFRFGYVPAGATIYRSIRRLPPGTILDVDLTGASPPRERTYWTLTTRPARSQDDGALAHLLSESVRTRLVADRPVGAFLSGGIDSSLVCALAARHTTGTLKTFTMGWEETEYDESVQAALVAGALGADHHDVRMGRSDVVSSVGRLAAVMDEPFADSSQLAVLLVSTAARRDVVVALSGDGGDELFAGYNRHRWLLSTRALRRGIPRQARRSVADLSHRTASLVEQLLRPIPPTKRPRLVADKVHKLADVIAAPSVAHAYHAILANEVGVGRARDLPAPVAAALAGDDRDDVLWGLRVADLLGYLPDDILAKVDRASMSVSLESRAPFLQPDLVLLALGMDADDLLGRSGGKQPLRALLGELLPSVAFDQTKTGFGIPVASLLRKELRQRLGDAIDAHEARDGPVELPWRALADELDAGEDGSAPVLWALLMFELWAEAVPHEICWADPPETAGGSDASRGPLRVGLYLPGVSGPPSGAWTRLRDLAHGLQQDPSVELFAAGEPALLDDLGIGPEHSHVVLSSRGIRRFARTSRRVQGFIDTFDLDVVQVEAPPVPQGITAPVVFSLHDLRAFDVSLWDLRSPGALYQRLIFRRQLSGVDAVLALSEWAARDFALRLALRPDLVHVVGPIVPRVLGGAGHGGRVPASLQDRPFAVAVGHLEPRKNIELLIAATRDPGWPAELALVLAGQDNGSERSLRDLAASAGADIRFLGSVSDEEKWWLLHEAEVVLLPSRLEGFGIVALEAIVAGTPVLVAQATALPEAAGTPDAVLPLDAPEAWSRRVRQLHERPEEGARLTRAQAPMLEAHSSASVIATLTGVYGSVVRRGRARSRR
jgi:asparagine synthase (glutamine-hydrolysing)